jgi:hypothetical protein
MADARVRPRGYRSYLSDAGKRCVPARREPDMTQHPVVPRESATRSLVPASDVEAWRLRRLVDAGFALPLALEVAATPGVDLHELLALLDRGCPPELAARILSPIDDVWSRP